MRCTEFARARGVVVNKIYKEIASGMNDNRKQLNRMVDSNPSMIIVEHKDRLTRFGFNLIEKLLQKQGCELLVVNRDSEGEKDLMKDMISVVTSFCCRLYGMRRSKNKVKAIKQAIET